MTQQNHQGHRGQCLCGKISYEITPPTKWSVSCHCESCRRASGAAMLSFVGVEDGQWRWTKSSPTIFASSTEVERSFCSTCGSTLTFRSKAMTGLTHFCLGTLDDPGAFPPSLHTSIEEKLAWLHIEANAVTKTGPSVVEPRDAEPRK